MLSSTAHWMPLIDAYSDYIPADFTASLDTLGDFPNQQAFTLLASMRAKYVVFHVDRYGTDAMTRLRHQLAEFGPYLRKRYADDDSWLYEIVGFPTPPTDS
jgi:hypothetical protein